MITIYIRRNSDGVVRVYTEDGDWQESYDYLWGEGNYCCDCNRSLFFRRADPAQQDDKNESDECGDDKYSIRIEDKDGKVLYEDDDYGKN